MVVAGLGLKRKRADEKSGAGKLMDGFPEPDKNPAGRQSSQTRACDKEFLNFDENFLKRFPLHCLC